MNFTTDALVATFDANALVPFGMHYNNFGECHFDKMCPVLWFITKY